ncbi:MAG: hypothetical protein DMF77_21340 [Acidobacteria bacterium]|nr:MAG: hypothetical protein DMF77_21340 [Acidobacteriota bacterium]
MIMLLIDRTLTSRPVARETLPAPTLRGPAVFLPPAEVLRKLQAADGGSVGRPLRLPPGPSDFAPPRVTIQVSFFYGEGPQG